MKDHETEFRDHWSPLFDGVQMYSALYQRVIIAIKHGFLKDVDGTPTDIPYLEDGNHITFFAESFVHGLGDGNF